MTDSVQKLEQLVEAVESAGANIAPTYLEYMPLAFAIANECGEAGRSLFHRICRQSEKYDSKDAEKLFSNALQKNNGKSTLGTVWHLAELAGVDVKKLSFTTPPSSHTRSYINMPDSATPPSTPPSEAPLPPSFPDYQWPRFLQQAIDCGESKAQSDILLLGAITVLGATLNKWVFFNYGHKDHYPCLQTFVLALPASGKGALTWVRQLAEPIHDELFSAYQQQMKNYHREKNQWDCMGKGRMNQAEPERPTMKLFLIAGDNSGTGMQENLMDNDGVGLICESEADTVSTAIGADYGHWSHTLRKAFDHDRLSYNRRANHEYRECTQLQLSVLLSGTPAQLCPLIPSPENGLFSRQLFYYMPAIHEWINQFDLVGEDYSRVFRQWGEQWKSVLNSLKGEVSGFRFHLSPEQQDEFNSRMAQLFSHAGMAQGSHMRSAVARIAINMCRIMCVVALLRSLEGFMESIGGDTTESLRSLIRRLLTCPGVSLCPHTPQENVTDGVVSTFMLAITPEDFEAVLGLAEPLYRHSCYVLMFLPDTGVSKHQPSSQEVFLSSLPMWFTRQQAMETARLNGISEKSVDTLLKRMGDKGIIESTGRGMYQFSSRTCACERGV